LDVFFDVPSGSYGLAAYMIELNLTGPTSGVHFTQFAEPQNPVFPGRVPKQTASRPPLPGTIAAANDDIPSGEDPILNRSGLIRVLFTADAGSDGDYTVSVDPNLARTNFTNGAGDLLTVSYFIDGNIRVRPLPEPSTMVLLCAVASVGVLSRFRRTRALGLRSPSTLRA
jgi:hypothetical protein